MRKEELRIGNYVNVEDGNIIQLDRHDMIGLLTNCYNVKPIPLTEEILLKCGFDNEIDEIDGEGYSIYFVTNTDYLVEYFHKRKEYIFTDDMGLKITISSLHQLQNLYYALTGEELEMNI